MTPLEALKIARGRIHDDELPASEAVCVLDSLLRQVEDPIDVVMAEYRYWRDNDTDESVLSVCGLANVIAALNGMPVTHHIRTDRDLSATTTDGTFGESEIDWESQPDINTRIENDYKGWGTSALGEFKCQCLTCRVRELRI